MSGNAGVVCPYCGTQIPVGVAHDCTVKKRKVSYKEVVEPSICTDFKNYSGVPKNDSTELVLPSLSLLDNATSIIGSVFNLGVALSTSSIYVGSCIANITIFSFKFGPKLCISFIRGMLGDDVDNLHFSRKGKRLID